MPTRITIKCKRRAEYTIIAEDEAALTMHRKRIEHSRRTNTPLLLASDEGSRMVHPANILEVIEESL